MSLSPCPGCGATKRNTRMPLVAQRDKPETKFTCTACGHQWTRKRRANP